MTIPAGETQLAVPFTLCGDTVADGDETFALGLVNPVNATIGDAIAQFTIQDDDEAVGRPNLTVNIARSAEYLTQEAPHLVYRVEVVNRGDGPASNFFVQSTLPNGVAFVRVENSEMDACPQSTTDPSGALQVNCRLSSLAAGEFRSVRIVGDITSVIPDGTRVAFGANADPANTVVEQDDGDNFALLGTTVLAPDLLIADGGFTKTRLPDNLICEPDIAFPLGRPCFRGRVYGTVVALRVTIRNQGSAPAPATTIRVAWPRGIALLDSPCASGKFLDVERGSCVASSSAAVCFDSCAVPTLPAGESTEVTLTGYMQPPKASGTVSVKATVDPVSVVEVVDNNSATYNLAVP